MDFSVFRATKFFLQQPNKFVEKSCMSYFDIF